MKLHEESVQRSVERVAKANGVDPAYPSSEVDMRKEMVRAGAQAHHTLVAKWLAAVSPVVHEMYLRECAN